MLESTYERTLFKTCDPEEITRLSEVVFVEGHLDKLDDLLITILPLANVIYYKYIRIFDDREYAKEDLISDAVLGLYRDMSLRWDKYIRIESYYSYFSTILRNSMIGLVHGYHNYYSSDEVDLETMNSSDSSGMDAYDSVETKLLLDSLKKNIIDTSLRILSRRKVNTNLLISIFNSIHVDKVGVEKLKSRVKVLGVSSNLFSFYEEHVEYVYRLAYNYHYAVLGGKQKMISRISDTLDRFEDVTYKMLSLNYYDSIIPEIYAEFGSEVAKKFVKTFSGRTVKVPDYRDFCDNLLGGVVLSLADGDKSNLYRIAEEYEIPYKTLSRIYSKASKYDIGEKG